MSTVEQTPTHMKSRRLPLKGDHNLLTRDTHTQCVVRPGQQVKSEVVLVSGHLKDLSTCGLPAVSQRRQTSASPTRRLRFEDETETEAETRYLERQQQTRWVGQQATGVPVSRLHLNQNPTTVLRQREVEPMVRRVGMVMDRERGRSLNRKRLNLQTELLRDTYIGYLPAHTCHGGSGASSPLYMQVRRRAGPQTTPPSDLPINPYPPTPLIHPSSLPLPPVTSLVMSPVMRSQRERTNGSQGRKELNQDKEGGSQPQPRSKLNNRQPRLEEGAVDTTNSSSPKAKHQAESTSDSSDEQVKQPMNVELQRDEASHPEQLRRNGPSRSSLCHLLSSVRLIRTRTGSLDRLTSKTQAHDPDHTPSGSRKCILLKKSLSNQSRTVGTPFLKLRKSLSVQSLVSIPKDASAVTSPADE